MNPLLSIIIPTKSEAKNIARCLKSCLSQTYRPLEIIVVDNHSTDGTLKIAKATFKNYPITQLLNYKFYSHGLERSAQRNFGAKKSSGDYLLFIDADMELTPRVVEKIIPLLRGVAEGRGVLSKSPPTIVSIPEIGAGKNYWGRVLALDKNCYLNELDLHAARAFPKKLFKQLHGYDENLYAAEDWDLTLRSQAIDAALKLIQSCVIHHEATASLSSLLAKDRYYIKNISKFRTKHPQTFSKLSSPLYRLNIYLKSLPLLLRHPFLTHGLIFYKTLAYLLYKISTFKKTPATKNL